MFFHCCFDSLYRLYRQLSYDFQRHFFRRAKHLFLFKNLNMFDSCKKRCSSNSTLTEVKSTDVFSLKISKCFAVITAFQTAVHFCTGMRAGLRNIKNENRVSSL